MTVLSSENSIAALFSFVNNMFSGDNKKRPPKESRRTAYDVLVAYG